MRNSGQKGIKKTAAEKRKYQKPTVESDLIYETQALGCAQCLNRNPETAVGWGDGSCGVSINNY